MRRYFSYSILAAFSLLLLGCEQLSENSSKGRQLTVNATFDNGDSKATVLDGGTSVYWEPEDEIKVFCGSSSGRLVSTNVENSKTATFTGTVSGEVNPSAEFKLYGLYPYREDASFDDGVITTTLPSEQYAVAGSFDSRANIAMAVSDSHELSFRNVCGGLRFTLTHPGIKRIVFESNGGEYISGEFSAAFEDGVPVVKEVKHGSSKVVLEAEDGSALETGVWYYMSFLPSTLSEGYTITFSTDTKSADLSVSRSQSVTRGTYGTISDIDNGLQWKDTGLETVTINPNYKDLTGYDVHLSSADTQSGTYVLDFSGDVASIKPGNVLALDADSLGYLVRVNEITRESGRVTLKAEQASMCDLFGNTSFVLSTATGETLMTKSGGVQVIHPVSVSYRNAEGVLVTEDLSSPTKAVSDRGNIWRDGIIYDGEVLWEKGDTYLKMDECHVIGSLDLEYSMSFGGFEELEENISDIEGQYRSNALAMDAKLIGSVEIAEVVHFHTEGKFDTRDGHNLTDYNEIVRHKILPDADFKFVVGGVPVWISIGTDLFREVNLQGEGELDFVLGYRNTAELGSGFRWSQTGGMTPVASAGDTFTLVGPTLSGHGKVTGKCWPFYPRINVRFYGVLGPNFDIKPYLQSTLEGGFKLDAGGDSYAGWSLSNEAGLDFKAGLSTYFMNYEAGRWYETNDFTLFSTPLYTSPTDLKRADDNECKVGKKSTLKFGVIDRNDLLGKEVPTVLPQVVTFEGEGEISRKFAVADKGQVTVDWTPKKTGDTMKAILYGPKGEVIKEVTVDCIADETCPDESHPHAIDLGLSVKWACCNVGATKPEEYGGYYAWGETEEKSVYNEVTYKYAHGTDWDGDGWYEDGHYEGSGSNRHWVETPTTWDYIGTDISGTQYDVAHVKWGGSWRMPTLSECEELILNCDTEWTTLNGVEGIKFTSRINGNSIFLPAAGFRYYGGLGNAGSDGYCWSSSLYTGNSPNACSMGFGSGIVSTSDDDYRLYGQSVRPVSE